MKRLVHINEISRAESIERGILYLRCIANEVPTKYADRAYDTVLTKHHKLVCMWRAWEELFGLPEDTTAEKMANQGTHPPVEEGMMNPPYGGIFVHNRKVVAAFSLFEGWIEEHFSNAKDAFDWLDSMAKVLSHPTIRKAA